MNVRFEGAADAAEVDRVMRRAFPGPDEARIVRRLREAGVLSCCVVAGDGDPDNETLIGALVFSPVTIVDEQGQVTRAWGLGPMAVVPEHQRSGVGEAMFEHWRCHGPRPTPGVIVVLGHASYYPRFGFQPASKFGVRWEHPCPDEAFMLLETEPGAADGMTGVVSYDDAFNP